MRQRTLRTAAGAVLVGLLATGGALSTASPAMAATPPSVPAAALTDSVQLTKASISVTAVSPALQISAKTEVKADFAAADTATGRWVSVQYRMDPTATTWKSAKTVQMNKAGVVTVQLTTAPTLDYRVVALNSKGKTVVVTTAAKHATSVWTMQAEENFSQDFKTNPDSLFATRANNEYGPSRLCSAPADANATTSSGIASLKLTKLSSTSAEAKARKAARGAKGCKYGVYHNAMISTEGTFTTNTGTTNIVAARVKFPTPKGAHGSVWLKAADGTEIDIIESFGKGKGITNFIHYKNSKGSLTKAPSKGYVAASATKSSSWWSKYHTFSVEWDAKQLIFRMDGKETKRISKNMSNRQYSILASLVSSDWELAQSKGTKNATMQVDWIRAWEKTAA